MELYLSRLKRNDMKELRIGMSAICFIGGLAIIIFSVSDKESRLLNFGTTLFCTGLILYHCGNDTRP